MSKFDKSKRQDRPRPLLDVDARAHSRKGIDTQVQVRQKTCSCEKIRIIAEFCTGCKLSRFFFFFLRIDWQYKIKRTKNEPGQKL